MSRTIILREHEPRELAIADADARFLLAHFGRCLELVPTRRSGVWRIKAKSYVGTIVAPGVELRIRPKCGLAHLFAMLSYAHRLARLRHELVHQAAADDLSEFLIAIFAGHVEDLVRGGLRRGYVERTERIGVLRGRLLLGEQLRRAPGADVSLACHFEDFTADLPLNQVIRHTLTQVGATDTPELDRRLRRLRGAFATLSARRFRGPDFDRFVYDRLNRHYEPIHGLCRLILEARGAEEDSGAHPMGSFIVNMDTLFEKFLETWLAQHLPPPWRVQGQRKTSLDRRGTVQMFPDLLLYHDRELRLVADAKYKLCKGVPSNDDAYQALAYCRALGLRTAVLLYPDLDGPHTSLVIADQANELITDGIDLGTPWATVETGMHGLMQRLLELATRDGHLPSNLGRLQPA